LVIDLPELALISVEALGSTRTIPASSSPMSEAPADTRPEALVPCQVRFARFWRRHRRGWQGRRPEGVAAPRRAVEDAARRGEGKPERANVA
jgi:hypothetical protein